MFSPFRELSAVVALLVALATTSVCEPLKVCADPENPPFSTRQRDGFDNKIALVIGAQLGQKVTFVWSRMGRGFLREYLNKGRCDMLLGVPEAMRGLLVTQPYYRASYMFVTRTDVHVTSLDDPTLRQMKIGLHVLDEDYTPPATALARRGIVGNIVGFDMDHPGRVVRAVADRRIDVAIVWGPIAGFYARRLGNKVRIAPVSPNVDRPALPLAFNISVGLRRSDGALYERVNAALQRARPMIESILRRYNVPTLAINSKRDLSGD